MAHKHLEDQRAYQREYNRRKRLEDPDWAKARDAKDRARNKEKRMEAFRAYLVKNPEKRELYRQREKTPEAKAKKRERHLKRKFGITHQQFEAILFEQDGKCAICKVPQALVKRFRVDHNHVTNEVRGLLCQNCNSMLGQSGDSVSTLAEAIKYLTERGSYGKGGVN